MSGHCNVPCTYVADPILGRWIKRQRHEQCKSRSPEQRKKLEKLGFKFAKPKSPQENNGTQWSGQFKKLKAFHEANGHCQLPTDFDDNNLKSWVKEQKSAHRKDPQNGVLPICKSLLDTIDFGLSSSKKSAIRNLKRKEPPELAVANGPFVREGSWDGKVVSQKPGHFKVAFFGIASKESWYPNEDLNVLVEAYYNAPKKHISSKPRGGRPKVDQHDIHGKAPNPRRVSEGSARVVLLDSDDDDFTPMSSLPMVPPTTRVARLAPLFVSPTARIAPLTMSPPSDLNSYATLNPMLKSLCCLLDSNGRKRDVESIRVAFQGYLMEATK